MCPAAEPSRRFPALVDVRDGRLTAFDAAATDAFEPYSPVASFDIGRVWLRGSATDLSPQDDGSAARSTDVHLDRRICGCAPAGSGRERLHTLAFVEARSR